MHQSIEFRIVYIQFLNDNLLSIDLGYGLVLSILSIL